MSFRVGMKFFSTVKILFTLGMARTFGEYEHSAWNGEFDYARYRWLGKSYAFPTGHIESAPTESVRFGFKSRTQLPLFMLWREFRDCDGEVYHATVIFTTSSILRRLRNAVRAPKDSEQWDGRRRERVREIQ